MDIKTTNRTMYSPILHWSVCIGLCFGLSFQLVAMALDNADESQQTFSAGVTAMELPEDKTVVTMLGKFKVCKVIAAKRFDVRNSGCFLKKMPDQRWEIEAWNAVCQLECDQQIISTSDELFQ
jgi:hypothetical protein